MGLNTEDAYSNPGLPVRGEIVEALYKSQAWYEAYMAALFESDREQIGESIRRAKFLVLHRERQLFACALDPKEQRALNNALHALRALQGCLKL